MPTKQFRWIDQYANIPGVDALVVDPSTGLIWSLMQDDGGQAMELWVRNSRGVCKRAYRWQDGQDGFTKFGRASMAFTAAGNLLIQMSMRGAVVNGKAIQGYAELYLTPPELVVLASQALGVSQQVIAGLTFRSPDDLRADWRLDADT